MMWRGGSEDIGIYLQEKNMGRLTRLDDTGSQQFDMVLYANIQKNFHESFLKQIRIP